MNITMLIIGIGIGTFVASMLFLFALGSVSRDSKKKNHVLNKQLRVYWSAANEYQLRQALAMERISDQIKKFLTSPNE